MKNHAATTAGWLAIAALSCVASLGCGKSQAQMGPPQPGAPEVQVSLPVSATVTDYEDFPGRIVAVKSDEVPPRGTGYLEKVHFTQSDDRQKGDLLLEEHPPPTVTNLRP